MQSTVTRATIVWFVVAGVSGVGAVYLHLYRSAFGGGSTAMTLAVGRVSGVFETKYRDFREAATDSRVIIPSPQR